MTRKPNKVYCKDCIHYGTVTWEGFSEHCGARSGHNFIDGDTYGNFKPDIQNKNGNCTSYKKQWWKWRVK